MPGEATITDDPIALIEAAIERLRDDVGAIAEPAMVTTRPDLIDRVIHVDMPTIPPEARRDDADTSAAWGRDRPLVFGALRILPNVVLGHKHRMADYERLGEAAARAITGTHWPGPAFFGVKGGRK